MSRRVLKKEERLSPALEDLLEFNAHQLSPCLGLDAGDDAGKAFVAHLLQLAQQPCLEKHLSGGGQGRKGETER